MLTLDTRKGIICRLQKPTIELIPGSHNPWHTYKNAWSCTHMTKHIFISASHYANSWHQFPPSEVEASVLFRP